MRQIVARYGVWKSLGAVAAALAFLGVSTVTLSWTPGTATALLAQSGEALERFLDRSPGERSDADIIKGKKGQKGKKGGLTIGRAIEPEQRALGKIFDTPPEEVVKRLALAQPGPLALGDFGNLGLLPIDQLGPGPGPGPGFGGFPPGFSVVSPPGGGGVIPPPQVEPPIEPPVPAIPEPDTWALMLIGFGIAGAAMRRRRRGSLEFEVERGDA